MNKAQKISLLAGHLSAHSIVTVRKNRLYINSQPAPFKGELFRRKATNAAKVLRFELSTEADFLAIFKQVKQGFKTPTK